MRNKDNVRANDFENKERPSTRLKQFFDIFRHRFVDILKISLLQAVFNMPLVVSLVLFYILVRNSSSFVSLNTVFLIQGAAMVVALPIAFIGLSGSFYCFKKMCYVEGEYASSSFFNGMREEWKKGLLIGLLPGISYALTIIGSFYAYYYLTQVNPTIAGLSIAILVTQALVVSMVSYYSISQVVVYSNKLRYVLKNSFIMTLIRFPINLLVFIIHPGIIVALFAIMEITMYVGIVLLIFLVGIGHLLWVTNCLAAFDKFINQENYPDFYRKGLSNE